MKRTISKERPDWRKRAEERGFAFHTIDGERYWDERAYYSFSLNQIEVDLEAATAALHALAIEVAGKVVEDERLLASLAIPPHAFDAIRESWRRDDPSLYGRFDLVYDGNGPAKCLEYNADTPTALYETGVAQWDWLEDMIARGWLPKGADQFNSVHDKLVAALGQIAQGRKLYVTCMAGSHEDRGTIAYLEDCAMQAGLETRFVPLEAIGIAGNGPFLDDKNGAIDLIFKLYPWEWIFADPFGKAIKQSPTRFIEPPWKAVLSNKGLLPLMWQAAPGHPNLLEAYFESDPAKNALGTSFAKKPLYSREGANITLVSDAKVIDTDAGPYGAEGYVRQALAKVPSFDGNYAVMGSWIVAGEPAGICLREDVSPITKNTSRFVPHVILD
jgi:glutathionylspermidine synthase